MQEKDWKYLGKLRDIAVERSFDRMLKELQQLVQSEGKTSRDLVFEARDSLKEGFGNVRDIFDRLNFSRSNAKACLTAMVVNELLTDEELAGFSEEIQQYVARWLEF